MKIKNLNLFLVISLLFFLFSINFSIAISPSGANITAGTSQTAPTDAAGSSSAQAGNVTELNIFGYTTTQTWQGYFGNISGTIQLTDSNRKVLYNWSQASPRGEIYSSTNQTISWSNIQCFNYTASGTFASEAGNGGTTNLFGINLTSLESQFTIGVNDVDGVNETFTLSGAGTHDLFYAANQQFSEGECKNSRLYANNGQVNDKFEEALLYEPTTSSVVFTSIIDPDIFGFDNRSHDFEMLVLEDGHGTNVVTTPYYFFVELE